MATYRIKADKTGPRTFKKELQMISYRGDGLYSDEGNILISEKDVYYPGDYLSQNAISVVTDSSSFRSDGISTANKFSKGRPAALGIIEQFPEESEVSISLLGINRAETQQGIFDNVSTYGLNKKDWIIYAGFEDFGQDEVWRNKNSPAGKYSSTKDYDNASGSSVVITSYPVPFLHPSITPIEQAVSGIVSSGSIVNWARYIQSIAAMYIIEYMVNNFSVQKKERFKLSFLESKYPKNQDGTFNRLYWDWIWSDIDQGRFEDRINVPIIPKGRFVNFTFDTEEESKIDLIDVFGSSVSNDERLTDIDYRSLFFATTRFTWTEPNKGHYRIMTNPETEVWEKYWGISYSSLPQELKDWEFGVYESELNVPEFVKTYKLPYYLIEDSENAYSSLIFSSEWPQTFSDPSIPQVGNEIANGNLIGQRESRFSVITLTSTRAFRYQPGRISGFTYGVRVSEEGAGPGTVLEWGIENFTDGYFFRLKDGTDFSIVRRSTIPLGTTSLFIEAGYIEREVYVSPSTGVVKYADQLSETERRELDDLVNEGSSTRMFETIIEQNQMNGDGLNGQGRSGYIFNPDTVSMYKIEFGWYGAIGARFYMYIPVDNANSRWVEIHTLVIENQIGQPCLEDPFFFFKYRTYIDNPSRIRLPQFIEKYGASYYIDGGDEGTVSIASNKATNRNIPVIENTGIEVPTYSWATVAGIKPKSIITNTQGNSFKNKKEIFPTSMSLYSTVDAEIKLVNQFACQEHAFVFQEGYYCNLPESQRLRGIFSVNRLQTDESSLALLGLDATQQSPTLLFVEKDLNYPESSNNLLDETGQFVGWDAFNNSLHGSHLIGEDLYSAYLNPTQEGVSSPIGFSDAEIVINRSTPIFPVFSGDPTLRNWSKSSLIFRYPQTVPIKISKYRKDTTLLSTVNITNNKFYLFFTRDITQSTDPDSQQHFSDMQVGIIWSTPETSPAFPASQITKSRSPGDFGIINPKNVSDRSINTSEVDIVEDQDSGEWYVQDKEIPNSDLYRYYEGLPIDISDNSLKNNTIIINQIGSLLVSSQGLEEGELDFGLTASRLGEINNQFPPVPGEDGGNCYAIEGEISDLENQCTLTNLDKDGILAVGRYYLSSNRPWPSDLWQSANTINIEDTQSNAYQVITLAGNPQQVYTPEGTNIRLYLLPVEFLSPSIPPNNANPNNQINISVVAKYRSVILFTPGANDNQRTILGLKTVGVNILPIRFFIRMREGCRIGAISVGQLTRNGIIQSPFTPHGCSVSVRNINSIQDTHLVSGVEQNSSATKSIVAFSHPGTLTTDNYSYYDVSNSIPVFKNKKCPSFISSNPLAGAGFSGVGDYPLRWLEFKESGDAIGSYFIQADQSVEINLSDIFNISAESIGPSFWNNKALFVISRNLEENTSGKINVTFNYKEQ